MGNNVCSVCVKRDAPDTARKVDEKPVEARGEAAEDEENHSPQQNKSDDKSSQEQLKSEQLKPEQEQKIDEGQASTWAIHAGAVTISSTGVEVKPQMKFGAEVDNFNAEVGLGDVRDGIKIGAVAQAMVDARSEGNSVNELHENIKCDTAGFKEALGVAKGIFSSGKDKASELSKIAQTLGMDLASLKKIFGQQEPENDESKALGSGMADKAAQHQLQLRVEGSVGVGVSAEVRLGWADTQGYKMIGCGGKASAGAGLGADMFAGKHESGTSAMIILGIGNFLFEYTLPLEGSLEDTGESEKTEIAANCSALAPSIAQAEHESGNLETAISCPVPQSKDAEELEKGDERTNDLIEISANSDVPQASITQEGEDESVDPGIDNGETEPATRSVPPSEDALESKKGSERKDDSIDRSADSSNGVTKSAASPAISQPAPKLSKKAKQKARRERK